MYKLSKPRFSSYYQYEVVDILKRKNFCGLFPTFIVCDTIKNSGHAAEVVFLLNNPTESKKRINQALRR